MPGCAKKTNSFKQIADIRVPFLLDGNAAVFKHLIALCKPVVYTRALQLDLIATLQLLKPLHLGLQSFRSSLHVTMCNGSNSEWRCVHAVRSRVPQNTLKSTVYNACSNIISSGQRVPTIVAGPNIEPP
jgi:hypothetical protein